MNLKHNDIADDLAKGDTSMIQVNEEPLTYLELYSKCKDSIGNNRPRIRGILVSALERPSVLKGTGQIKLLLLDCLQGI
ncbi:hypothetical protein TNCV_2210511 [Trichonephila clavipes]|nr:hypothetical protein TNCV_2210511 [Trichonephila clavipes]